VKAIVFVCLLLAVSSCATTYKDSYGNLAPQDLVFDCEQKCGWYDMRSNSVMAAYCKVKCMESKGYTQR